MLFCISDKFLVTLNIHVQSQKLSTFSVFREFTVHVRSQCAHRASQCIHRAFNSALRFAPFAVQCSLIVQSDNIFKLITIHTYMKFICQYLLRRSERYTLHRLVYLICHLYHIFHLRKQLFWKLA